MELLLGEEGLASIQPTLVGEVGTDNPVQETENDLYLMEEEDSAK